MTTLSATVTKKKVILITGCSSLNGGGIGSASCIVRSGHFSPGSGSLALHLTLDCTGILQPTGHNRLLNSSHPFIPLRPPFDRPQIGTGRYLPGFLSESRRLHHRERRKDRCLVE